MTSLPRGLTRAAVIVLVIGGLAIVSLILRPVPGEQTPWEFVRDALPHIDSIGKALALAFFTMIMAFMNFMALMTTLRLGAPIILIALVAVAALSPSVRHSRVVRAGFVLLGVGVVPLVIAGMFDNNPLGFGFLFAFVSPIAGLLIVGGTMWALVSRDVPPAARSR